ncbi:MAG: hypothetical protein V3U02_02040, partial [Calditrichia bacterium]
MDRLGAMQESSKINRDFSEMIAANNHIKFSPCGRRMLLTSRRLYGRYVEYNLDDQSNNQFKGGGYMSKINMIRVILGGLLAGFLLTIGEFVLNGLILAEQWEAAMKTLSLAPVSVGVIAWTVVIYFVG